MPQPIVMRSRQQEPSAWEKMAPYVMGLLKQQLDFGQQKKIFDLQTGRQEKATEKGQTFQKGMQEDTQAFQVKQQESFRTWKEGILKGEKEWDLKRMDIENGQELAQKGWSMLGPDESAGKFDVTIGDRVFSPPSPEIVKRGQHNILKMGQQYQLMKPQDNYVALGGGTYATVKTDESGNRVIDKIDRPEPTLTGDIGNIAKIMTSDKFTPEQKKQILVQAVSKKVRNFETQVYGGPVPEKRGTEDYIAKAEKYRKSGGININLAGEKFGIKKGLTAGETRFALIQNKDDKNFYESNVSTYNTTNSRNEVAYWDIEPERLHDDETKFVKLSLVAIKAGWTPKKIQEAADSKGKTVKDVLKELGVLK